MENLRKYLSVIRGVNTNTLFQSVYVLVLAIISALFWSLSTIFCFPSFIGLMIVIIITLITTYLMDDFNYVIPGAILFIFTNSEGFKNDELPVGLIVVMILFFLGIGIYLILKRKKLTFKGKTKSFYAFIYFAIFSFLPLIWNNCITKETFTLIFVYFNFLLYLIIYIICLLAFDKNSFFMVSKSMKYLCLVLAVECIVKIILLKTENPDKNVLSMWYYLGWGLCNEAGIMMCMGLPFVFTDAFNYKKPYQFILLYIDLVLIGFGMVMTTSRGTYLIGAAEILVLFLYYIIYHKKKLHAGITLLCVILAVLLTFQFTIGLPSAFENIRNYVFKDGLNSNGRTWLWNHAMELWMKSPLTILFGNGMVTELNTLTTHYGQQLSYWVYHSSVFETLAVYGGFGIVFLILHFMEKYRLAVRKFCLPVVVLLIVGFIFVDLYGMIDNTFCMYYYMIPLVLIMAGMDAYPGNKTLNNNRK